METNKEVIQEWKKYGPLRLLHKIAVATIMIVLSAVRAQSR